MPLRSRLGAAGYSISTVRADETADRATDARSRQRIGFRRPAVRRTLEPDVDLAGADGVLVFPRQQYR